MKRKLKAFTIMELMVGMTLTAILVLASLYAYSLIKKQYAQQKNMNEILDAYSQFESRLNHDLEMGELMKREGSKIVFEKEDSKVVYEFIEGGVLRQNNLSLITPDTFIIKAVFEKCSFNNLEALNGYVDHCIIRIFPFESIQQLTLVKRYSAATKMRLETS